MKILVLSKYSRKGASSRFRIFQYYPSLQAKGVELTTEALFEDPYLDLLYARQSRGLCILKSYFRRAFKILGSAKNYDVVWLEKELFPWIPWCFEKWFFKLLKVPYIVDYDDAIFHQYDKNRLGIVRKLLGKKCDRVMQYAQCVVAGNEYLAARARSAGAQKVVKIPTVVSEKVFSPKSTNNPEPVIGWIGSMSTAIYLEKLRPILRDLSQSFSFKFRVVGVRLQWEDVPLECVPWSEATEVSLVQSFDIGLMPLLDSPWERGKCGFKLIQYMACGKPVIADPVGVNVEIVEDGNTGYLVSEQQTWAQAIEKLLINSQQRQEMGLAGVLRFQKHYSLECWEDYLFRLFSEATHEK